MPNSVALSSVNTHFSNSTDNSVYRDSQVIDPLSQEILKMAQSEYGVSPKDIKMAIGIEREQQVLSSIWFLLNTKSLTMSDNRRLFATAHMA